MPATVFDFYTILAPEARFSARREVMLEAGARLDDVFRVRCVLSGEPTFTAGGRSVRLSPGEVVVTVPFEPYLIEPAGASASELRFAPEYAADMLSAFPGLTLKNFPGREAAERVRAATEAAEGASTELSRRAYVNLALEALVLAGGCEKRSHGGERAAEIIKFVFDRSAEKLDLPSVAAATGTSVATVSRVFSAAGVDFRVFLGSVRAMKARAALAREENARSSVLDIARSCGFSGAASFYRSYNRLFGAPPRR